MAAPVPLRKHSTHLALILLPATIFSVITPARLIGDEKIAQRVRIFRVDENNIVQNFLEAAGVRHQVEVDAFVDQGVADAEVVLDGVERFDDLRFEAGDFASTKTG